MLLLLFLLYSTILSLSNETPDEEESNMNSINLLSFPNFRIRNMVPDFFHRKYNLTSMDITYNNCSGVDNRGGYVASLSIDPDPLEMPGNVSLMFESVIMQSLQRGSRIRVIIQHRVIIFGVVYWEKILNQEYNLCDTLEKDCPKTFTEYGIPCSCPIPAAVYKHPMTFFGYLPNIDPKVPPMAKSGLYWIRLEVSDSSAELYSCQEIYVNLKAH